MGLSDDIKKVEANLKRIAGYYEDLNENNPFSGANANDIASSVDEMQKLEDAVQGVASRVADMDKSLESLVKKFKSANNEITSGSEGLKSMNSILSQSASSAERLRNHQQGISILSVKQLKKEKEKLIAAKSRLSIAEELLKQEEKTAEGAKLKKIKSALKVNASLQADINQEYANTEEHLDKEIKAEKKLQSNLGVIGGLLKGISKIPILGDIFNANEALEEMDTHLRNGGTSTGALIKGLKNLTSQLWSGVWNTSNLIAGSFAMMVSIFKDLDSGAGDYAKSMNVSYSEAMATRAEMQDLAISTNDAAINSKRLMESQMAISKEIGSTAKLNETDLVTMTAMVRKMGLTHKEAAGIQKLSLLNGKSLEKNNKLIVGAAKAQASKNKLVVNEKDVLREVSKASAALTLSLGNNPAELAKAVVQAKQFGLTLEQADKIANSLLSFEQSIENELSAELLTGKDLNFEKARQLALNNDIAGAAEEVAKQVGTSADFAKMNRIQQEAIAKAAGLSREELAKSIMDREALAKMSEVEGASAQEKYNNMRKTMSAEEAATALGDKKMAQMYEQQSVQDKFNDSMEQLKEMLANDLMPIFEGLSNFLREHMDLIKPIVKLFLTLKGVMMAINALQTLRNSLMKKEGAIAVMNKAKQIGGFMVGVGKYAVNAAASAAQTPIVGPVLALAALAAAFAGGYALKSHFADDMVSKGGYGNRTLMGPEGAIQLNNKDTVIAGTNLFGNDTISEPGKATEMFKEGELKSKDNSNMANVVSAVNALGARLDALAARPINVQVGEEVIVKAAVGNDPKITGDEMGKNSYQIN